jgi:AraC-like DNA-binding protein
MPVGGAARQLLAAWRSVYNPGVHTGPRETPRFRSYLVPELLRFVRERGGDAQALALRHGLDAAVEREPAAHIEVDGLAALFEDAAGVLENPSIGVHLAEQLSRRPLDLLQYACLNAPTVGDALRRVTRYMPLYNEFIEIEMEESATGARLEHRVLGREDGLGCHGNELWICFIVIRAREASRQHVSPRRCWFAHHTHGSVAELCRVLGTDNLVFGAGSNGLDVDRSFLEQPIPDSDPHLLSLLDRLGEARLAEVPAEQGLAGSVARVVQERLAEAPRLAEVARALGMSERTLQRRLAEAGVSYAQLLDAVRARMAYRQVREGWTVDAMAEALGFADRRAFLRAFQRWTGRTPSAVRAGSTTDPE